MKVCLISWTKSSISYINRFSEEINVYMIAEKDFGFWGKQPSNVAFEIKSIDAAVIAFNKREFEKFIIPYLPVSSVLHSMYVMLKQYGIPDENILYIPFETARQNKVISLHDLCVFYDRTELDRLELHINDHCNLKCANCSMLAGLVRNETNADFDLTIQALTKLKTIFTYIHEIDIIGGEPLLNPDILKYCDAIRKLYPKAIIYIVTNGIKICSMKQIFFDCLNRNRVKLSITYYPIFASSIENAICICKLNKIGFNVLKRRAHFLNLYDFSGNQDPKKVFDACKRKLSIIAMRENILSSCYTPFAFCYAEKAFKIGYHEDGIIDVLVEDLSPRNIIERFMQPMDCCRFCHCDQVNWHQAHSKYDAEDWSK